MASYSAKKNYIYNIIYQLVLIITPIITTPYVSRVLGADGVGQASFSTSIITFFVVFSALGFNLYAQREIAKNSNNTEEKSKIFWEVNICRFISTMIALMVNFLFVIMGVYQGNTTLMIILSINILATMFDIAYFYQGHEEFGKLMVINVLTKILIISSIFLFVKTSGDLWKYVLINSLGMIFGYVFMWLFLKKYLTKVKIKELKPFRHLRGTIGLFLPTIAVSLYVDLEKILIGVFSSDAQNGIYEQAEKIVRFALTIILCLGSVMIPRNSKNYSDGKLQLVKENIYTTTHFVWLLGIPMCLGMICLAPNFVPWFLGGEFLGSVVLLQVLSPLFLIIGFSNAIGIQYVLPTMQDKKYTKSVVIGAIVNLIISVPLVLFFKALGACFAILAVELTVAIVVFWEVRKELSFSKVIKTIKKPLLAGIVMFLITFSLSKLLSPSILNTFIILFAGIVSYALMIFALKDDLVISTTKQIYQKFLKKKP